MEQTLIDAAQLMTQSNSIVLTTHLMPDGDGLGAEIALYHYLQRLGKKVQILNPDPMPERFQFIDKTGVVKLYTPSTQESWDLGVIIDTNDPKRLGNFWSTFEKHSKKILILDHHPSNGNALALNILYVVDEKSSSIGELLYRFFHYGHDLLDPHSASFHLSPEIALGLYVSIMTDTNSFRYASTTALSHRIAADLIDYGLQPEEIYQNIYSSKSAQHLRLIGEVLANVQDTAQGKIAWVEIPAQLRKKYGAQSDDTQSIVNFLLLIKNAEILILLREEDDGKIKVSLKSKGKIKVSATAQYFGGGGHEFAAGFSSTGTLTEIRDQLLKRIVL